MTRDQVVALAAMRGWTHVVTLGGVQDLELWDPYGEAGRARYRGTIERGEDGRWRIHDLAPDRPERPERVLGAWRLLVGAEDPAARMEEEDDP